MLLSLVHRFCPVRVLTLSMNYLLDYLVVNHDYLSVICVSTMFNHDSPLFYHVNHLLEA